MILCGLKFAGQLGILIYELGAAFGEFWCVASVWTIPISLFFCYLSSLSLYNK